MPNAPVHVSEDAVPVDFEQLNELKERPLQQLLGVQMSAALPLFQTMNVAIVEADEHSIFITSDNPCAWTDPDLIRFPPSMRHASLVAKDIEVTLPISPRQTLLYNRKGCSGHRTAPAHVILEFNRRIVAWAHEEIVVNTKAIKPEWFQPSPLPAHACENTRGM